MIGVKSLEIIGSVIGVAGAVLIALNTDVSKYGFILFFISSLAFMAMARIRGMGAFFINQLVFQLINVVGIYRWFF